MDKRQKYYLSETARWQKLLGVVLVVCTVFIALMGVVFIVLGFISGDGVMDSDVLGKVTGALLGIFYFLLAVLYYYFAVYLLRSSKAIKAWEESDDEADLTEGLKNTESFFRLSGILAIAGICTVGFALVGAAIAAIIAIL